ncbi:MAG TPA: hypothetical protein DEG96_09950 [Candidatus Atribacteria bacterium]|uniref:Methyltransferase domain-containing protein n=1 Tax=candidate division TA06 bacterium 34_109 TaxID=1635277 RepID=A0A117M5Y3_UNCT6|nr:MAG: hypothetical protein XE03_1666 [candidate division TA06 bacterium 34_109]HBY58156.1 hypothetical protein [Candidatus Atribacteria bacterium]
MSNHVSALAHKLIKGLKFIAFDVIRRYHSIVPPFVECYAGGPRNIGPVFKKEAHLLYALGRLFMPNYIIEIGCGASTIAFAEAIRENGRGHVVTVDISESSIKLCTRRLKLHGLLPFVSFIKGSSNEQTIISQVADKLRSGGGRYLVH